MTGGDIVGTHIRDVLSIDTRREFAILQRPPMLTARGLHGAVYHAQYLYVLGGYGPIEECERYVCVEDRWESLPALPVACFEVAGVVVERSLYALGGGALEDLLLDLIQRLSLDSLTWEVLQLTLPQKVSSIPCFKLKSDNATVYLVLNEVLCTFQPTTLQIQQVKTLSRSISSYGQSYFRRGVLYCKSYIGVADRLEINLLEQ
jgi:hypothetical protein